MEQNGQTGGDKPEDFRAFLVYLARLHLDPRLESKIDAEDIVQMALLQAHEKRDQFRGENRKAWLRQILLNTLANEIAKLRNQKNDVVREQSLDGILEKSSARVGRLVAADQTTPQTKAMRDEEALRWKKRWPACSSTSARRWS